MDQAEDVEVSLGHNRRYKFHSGTLARNSTFFADMLTDGNAAKLNGRAKSAGVKVRWLFELVRLPDLQCPAGRLALVELTANGERADGRNGLVVNENGLMPKAARTMSAYETVFYAFYNTEIKVDDRDMSSALAECYLLLLISDYLGCTRLISKPIDVALTKHGQDLYRAIEGKPDAWIDMGCRIKSELIFRECMIHLVGKWRVLQSDETVRKRVREIPGLQALVEKYYRALQAQAKKLELIVLTHYPGKLAAPVDDMPIKREAYAKDILIWMALSFFRHWVGQRLLSEQGRFARDSGFALYTQLGTGGEAYLDKSIINQFHSKFPMTKKALNVLENHVFEIKACIKEVVRQTAILKNMCQLDVHRFPVKHLTCTVFLSEDFPWAKKPVLAEVRPMKEAFQRGGNDIARLNLDTTRGFQERSLSIGSGDTGMMHGMMDDEVSDGEEEFPSLSKRARLE